MRHLHASGNHLAGVHHRAATVGNHALGLTLHRDFATRVNELNIWFGIDVGEERAPYPNLFQRLHNFLLVAEFLQGLVGYQQHLLIATFLAYFADFLPRLMSFHHLRIRQRHTVNHLARQSVDLFSKTVSIHLSIHNS